MIRVEHLSKSYGPRLAVADVTFDVQKGEILGFLGPNGAGKTTTLRILTGYLPPSGGTVEVAGLDVVTQSLQARSHIGYLPETVPIYPEMSVRGYLQFMARIKKVAENKTAVERVMEKVRIAHRANDQVGKLSKGLRQRVGLAQALLGDPDVLCLDEPTSGLDPKQIIETRNLIRSLRGDHTVILSTHILPEVAATCSRIVIISQGRVVAEDTPENLDRRLKGAESLTVTVRGPRAAVSSALRAVPRVMDVRDATVRAKATTTSEVSAGTREPGGLTEFLVDSEVGADIRESLARAIIQGGWGLLEMRPAQLTLEEIFLQLTTSDETLGAAA